MKLARAVLRSFHHGIHRQSLRLNVARSLSTDVTSGHAAGGGRNSGSSESADDFERRIFGDSTGSGSRSDSFFQKLDRVQQARWSYGANRGNGPDRMDDIDDGLDTLSDGMDGKLKEAAEFFEVDHEECDNEDYSFRPDINFNGSYDVTDLDLRKPGVWLPEEPDEMDVTTEEVLKKADFRNVRFLAQFITEAGIIIKRSQSGISAKAQRKVAREIKTARAFGLMPFTTMGTKSFAFGKTMENLEADYQHQTRYEDPDDDEDLQAVDIP